MRSRCATCLPELAANPRPQGWSPSLARPDVRPISGPTGLPSTPAGSRLASVATTLLGSAGAGPTWLPIPRSLRCNAPATDVDHIVAKAQAEPPARRTCRPIATPATRRGLAVTKAASPEGRAVKTETLFGFLMVATIGPADPRCCRIGGQPCLASHSTSVQPIFATHTTVFGCSSKVASTWQGPAPVTRALGIWEGHPSLK